MGRMPFFDVLRAQYVHRWGTVHTDHQQSLAEHTFNVLVIAIEIADRMGEIRSVGDRALLMSYALLHDIDEVYTGDIPTPTKNKMSKGDRDKLSRYADSILAPPRIKSIVKAADFMEAYLFLSEHGRGIHAKQVLHDMYEHINNSWDSAEIRSVCMAMTKEFQTGERSW